MELLYNAVTDFRNRIADDIVIAADQDIKNSSTLEFYKNDIKNYKDCDKFLDKVFEQEGKRQFKISFDFGTVIQLSEPKSQDGNKIPKYSIVDDETDKIVSYRINRPEVNRSMIHIPSIIVSKQNLNDYKKYVHSTVIQMQERTIVDTQEMFVAIFSMLICVYRLPYNSAGLCNECLKIHKNRKEIRYVDCQYNYMICFWTAYSFIVMSDRQGKFLHPTSRVALAKKELFKYYNVKRYDQHKFLINYPGFDFATDTEEISRRLNLNINIYQYIDIRKAIKPINRRIDESNNIYNPFYQLLCSYHNTSINDEGEEINKDPEEQPRDLQQSKIASTLQSAIIVGNPTEFNILLVTDDCGNSHFIYIVDANGLLGIKIYSICKVHAIPAHDKYSHVKRKMDAHMKKCKENKQLLLENTHLKLEYVGQTIKRVVLDKYPKPYAPHILQNKSHKYLLANNRVNELKPIKFYITYKFFTLDRKVNKKCGEFSFQHANLEPTVNFIDEWLKLLFEEAKQVKIDNKYQDENIPQCFDVPVLGWDSSKFDTSLIFRNLHQNKYIISKYIGSGAHPKQIVVRNKENSVTLKFIGVKSYLAPNMEYDAFIKDIGKVVLSNPIFPEEYLNCDNYQIELDKSEAFAMQSFINQLKNSSISISEYNNYIKNYESFAQRWDYMRHCLEQDTLVMLHPIDNMINFYFEFKVDMLLNTSLAKNSCQVKYSFVYKDFDISESYNDVIYDSQDPKDDDDVKQFILTPQYWQLKVNDYNEQDK
ncbi:MAG: hypothetical protein EZS28_032309 [Streblomastix strix]|uniref:Uncharacterized protein n=1 Tax=Streblomastix strix TaxID=222440 RepID=A0A5J4UPQ8_9EUKA|nr:MAG: hypothetical protein EZS28_032309 [Streblomastix strix]